MKEWKRQWRSEGWTEFINTEPFSNEIQYFCFLFQWIFSIPFLLFSTYFSLFPCRRFFFSLSISNVHFVNSFMVLCNSFTCNGQRVAEYTAITITDYAKSTLVVRAFQSHFAKRFLSSPEYRIRFSVWQHDKLPSGCWYGCTSVDG